VAFKLRQVEAEGGEGFFVRVRRAADSGGEEAAAGYAKVKNLRLVPTRVYQGGGEQAA
jgi:hypothetical protein